MTLDGRVIDVDSRANFVMFNGEPVVLVIARDITNRKLAEQALKHSEEEFQSAIENLHDGFALYDSDERLVFCNDEYRALHTHVADLIKPGVTIETLVRKSVERGAIPKARGQEKEFLQDRLRQYRNPSSEPIIRTYENGITINMRESRTPQGGFVTAQTNITEQVKAESLLQAAVDSIPDGFALYDNEDQLVLFNDNYVKGRPELAEVMKIGTTFEEQARIRESFGIRD